MSWFTKENGEEGPETPKKSTSFIQIPESSPLGNGENSPRELIPPSTTTMKIPSLTKFAYDGNKPTSVGGNTAVSNGAMDAGERQRRIDALKKRVQAHSNYPLIKKAFSYLDENELVIIFSKFKGNLREITRELNSKYDKGEIIKQQEEQHKKEEEVKEQKKRIEQNARISQERKRLEHLQSLKQEQQEEPPLDRSPEKSTKHKMERTKRSIIDKYNRRQKTLDEVIQVVEAPQPKKRRLVRASSLKQESSDEAEESDDDIEIEDSRPETKNELQNQPQLVNDEEQDDMDDMIVADDDIEKVEEKYGAETSVDVISILSDQEEERLSDDEDDSDMESDGERYGYSAVDEKVFEFLNNCSLQDLCDIGSVQPAMAEKIITRRPFGTLQHIAEENFSDVANGKKMHARAKTVGQKLIDTTENKLRGYQAVDSLIKKCSAVGKEIETKIKKWGVSVTGKKGELEVVDIDVDDEGTPQLEDDDDDDVMVIHHRKRNDPDSYFKEKPQLLADDIELKNYQQVGVNWINLLYQSKLSGILADEMGLGKTCQVIGFMAYLKQLDPKTGPHLVVVPASTLENWLREFNKFCPSLRVQAYYGSQSEREDLRQELYALNFDVLVTTYSLAAGTKQDYSFLKHIPFNVVVYDEGHMLKNSLSERYVKLMKLKGQFRLLLTGTPLQNNLKELVSLLAFILPDIFVEKKDDLHGLFSQKVKTFDQHDDYNPLLSVQAISKAKTMMTPFVLRRKKDQVLQHLPAKTHRTEYCELLPVQKEIYDEQIQRAKVARAERERRKELKGKEAEKARLQPMPSSTNIMMQLRKASLHPMLFRHSYTDEKLRQMAKSIKREPQYLQADETYIFEDMQVMSDYELNRLCLQFPGTLKSHQLPDDAWKESGKVRRLMKILPEILKSGEKVLLFSLFTQVLDVLEKVMSGMGISYLRLDGSTAVDERQDIIDTFYDDKTVPVFLLSTKAGGFGINLVCASTVIIFDQSFNPHDDRQAEDRAHRVGQTKEVSVIRLITKDTVEEKILQLAENKLALDKSISAEDGNEKVYEENTAALFENILFGDESKLNTQDKSAIVID